MAVLALAGCGTRQSHDSLQAAFVGGAAAQTAGIAASGDGATVAAGGTAAPVVGGTGGVTAGGSTGGGGTGGGTVTGKQSGTGGGSTGGSTGGSSGSGTGTGTGSGSGGRTTGPTGRTGGTGGGSAGSSARQCTGKEQPITLGSVGEQSGVAGAVVAGGPQVVAAWAKYINAHGGLACHQVNYIIADDGGDPSKNAALTQQLVEQNHVVAFVQNDAPLAASGGESYLASHNIPVIGSGASGQLFYNHPNFFPQAADGDYRVANIFAGGARVMNADQKAHVGAVACQETSSCTAITRLAPSVASKLGLKLVYNGTGSVTQPDYSAVCSNAKQAGATALLVALDGNSLHRFARSCASVNYHPLLFAGQGVTPDITTDGNLDKFVVETDVRPWFDTSNPSIALMNQVLAQYAPGVSAIGQANLGWVAAQLLQYASTFFPAAATITSADILAAMDKVKNYDVGGTTGPLTFTAGHNAPGMQCYWVTQVVNGKFIMPVGNDRRCL